MIDPKPFQDLSAKISELIAASPARDVEKNIRALLSSAFTKLDLVTREEFDVQREVLGRARQKLSELEERIARLESGSSPTPPAEPK